MTSLCLLRGSSWLSKDKDAFARYNIAAVSPVSPPPPLCCLLPMGSHQKKCAECNVASFLSHSRMPLQFRCHSLANDSSTFHCGSLPAQAYGGGGWVVGSRGHPLVSVACGMGRARVAHCQCNFCCKTRAHNALILNMPAEHLSIVKWLPAASCQVARFAPVSSPTHAAGNTSYTSSLCHLLPCGPCNAWLQIQLLLRRLAALLRFKTPLNFHFMPRPIRLKRAELKSQIL